MDGSKAAATTFLASLLRKTLRITTSDTRLFVGEFKCTDADRNIILSRTYEYRLPSTVPSSTISPATVSPATSSAPSSHPSPLSIPATESRAEGEGEVSETKKVVLDMTSRYLGLVVVPGEFITKIEVEEFASQVKAGGSKYADLGVGVV